ncbi:hypothetical protein TFLX_01188 [Thermoflexales bacterium]|nr:hypothetical protein TFLX_01188 [Thermoflexales bacterium]
MSSPDACKEFSLVPAYGAPMLSTRSATRRTIRRQQPAFLYRLLILACGSLLLSTTGHIVGRAFALVTHQQVLGNNVFATTVLVAPGDFSASPQGHAVALSWSDGQSGTGYEVFGAANGSSRDCTGATFTSLGSTTATGYSDNDRFAQPGTWFCYQVQTTRGDWSSQQNNPITAVQLGFVAASLQLLNAGDSSACGEAQSGVADELDCGDQIVVGFNQPVDPATGPDSGDTVCADQSSGTIWLGSAGTGDCTSGEDVHLGRLEGGTIENGNSRFAASYDWNTNHTVLIVTMGALVSGSAYPTLSDSTWTLIPTTNVGDLLSDFGGYHICDTNADGNCLPEANWTLGSSSSPDSASDTAFVFPPLEAPVLPTATPSPIEAFSATDPTPTPTSTSPSEGPPTTTPEQLESLPTTTPLPSAVVAHDVN